MHFIPCGDKEIFNNTCAQIWQYITKNTKEDICCLTKSITITICELFLKTVTLDVLVLFHLSFSTNNCCKNVTTYQNFRNIQISIPILGFFLGTLRNCSYNIIESKCIFSDSSLTRKGEKTLAILNLCHRCFCVN